MRPKKPPLLPLPPILEADAGPSSCLSCEWLDEGGDRGTEVVSVFSKRNLEPDRDSGAFVRIGDLVDTEGTPSSPWLLLFEVVEACM